MQKVMVLWWLLLVWWRTGAASNILVISPYRGHSHSVGPLKIADELWKKGHNLTVASFYPKADTANYTSISLKAEHVELSGFFSVPDRTFSTFESVVDFHAERELYLPVLENENFRALASRKFDLVIYEYFSSEVFFGLIHKIGAPFILVHTTVPYPWQNALFSEPQCESYAPHILSTASYGKRMTIFERLKNFLELYGVLIAYDYVFAAEDQALAEKYFGPLPDVREIGARASLFFVNAHHSMSVPKPLNPSTIEIGGIHIDPQQPLPKELQNSLDNSEGAIFFSLGSVMKGSTLPANKKAAFLNVFKSLTEIVLWKWEGEFPDSPPNVYTSKWFPQSDILAHPKTVMYIGHCGALGLQEAVNGGVPTICIPFFADQFVNAKYLKDTGMGLSLDWQTLDESRLREAVNEILHNPKYKENAVRISNAFRDRPLSPREAVVYWSEYVIRHKGAPHMISPARRMSWVEYHNADVIAIIVGAILFVAYALFRIANSVLGMKQNAKKASYRETPQPELITDNDGGLELSQAGLSVVN